MFKDRRDAGRQSGRRLAAYATLRPVVIAPSEGGVPVAAEIADRLGAPLDVVVVRKIGLPWQPELAIGAVAEGNVCVVNDALVEETGVSGDELEAAITRERVELERRARAYRPGRSPQRPPWFLSIGEHYEDFRQTSDDEVVACLQWAAKAESGRLAQVPG